MGLASGQGLVCPLALFVIAAGGAYQTDIDTGDPVVDHALAEGRIVENIQFSVDGLQPAKPFNICQII